LIAATGLRISEALGLKWADIDCEGKQVLLCRVWVNDQVVEKMKTDESGKPVPLSDLLADSLRCWLGESPYAKPGAGFSLPSN